MLIGICSDERKEIEQISGYIIQKTQFLDEDNLRFFTPADILVDMEYQNFKCNIMVIKTECEAEGFNGIQVAHRIVQQYPKCQIIFYSNHYNDVSAVYRVKHCYFMLLKQMEIHIEEAFQLAQAQLKERNHGILEFVCDRRRICLRSEDIIYIRREQRKTMVCTTKREYECYLSLADILSKVGDNFVRCHTGYIVNMDYVEEIGKDYLGVSKTEKIPAGRTYIKTVRELYKKR